MINFNMVIDMFKDVIVPVIGGLGIGNVRVVALLANPQVAPVYPPLKRYVQVLTQPSVSSTFIQPVNLQEP